MEDSPVFHRESSSNDAASFYACEIFLKEDRSDPVRWKNENYLHDFLMRIWCSKHMKDPLGQSIIAHVGKKRKSSPIREIFVPGESDTTQALSPETLPVSFSFSPLDQCLCPSVCSVQVTYASRLLGVFLVGCRCGFYGERNEKKRTDTFQFFTSSSFKIQYESIGENSCASIQF